MYNRLGSRPTTLILELTPEEEARLRAKAARAGVDAAEYLRALIADEPPAPKLSQPEWKRLLDEVGSELDPSTPNLSDEAISRDSIYAERA